jgi:uncharacterized DUF497 family protein
MRFEWDAEKNRINKQKHDGLSFESAAFVYRLESKHDKEESIRIIPAREANKRERRIYIQQAAG